MRTNTKSYSDEGTDFYDKEIHMAGSDYTCLAVINVDSDLKKEESYYLQVPLQECKYIAKKMITYSTDHLEISPEKSDEEWIKTKYCDNIF